MTEGHFQTRVILQCASILVLVLCHAILHALALVLLQCCRLSMQSSSIRSLPLFLFSKNVCPGREFRGYGFTLWALFMKETQMNVSESTWPPSFIYFNSKLEL